MSVESNYRPEVYELLGRLHRCEGAPWDDPDCDLWIAFCVKEGLVEYTPERDGVVLDITLLGQLALKLRDEPKSERRVQSSVPSVQSDEEEQGTRHHDTATVMPSAANKTKVSPGVNAAHNQEPLPREIWDIRLKDVAPEVVEILRDAFSPPCSGEQPGGTTKPEAVWAGKGKVRIGDEPPLSLEQQFADVLQALVEQGTATKPELQKRSGRDDPGGLLKKLVQRFPKLEPYITFPGRRGRGGYSTTIKDATKVKS